MIAEDFLKIFEMVEDSYSVRIPTYVDVSKTTTKAVNLNIYRNLHHHHLNTQKKNFAEMVKPLLRDKPRAEKVWIHYTIFAPRNGRLDTMNVGSIADKYFSDTMVEAGKIPDDNQEHIVLSTFSFGGVTKMDGHAIATVNILKQEELKNMRILLDQEDIENALNAYVKTLNIPNADEATVDLGVENDEIVAEVIMGDAPVKNKGGRPRKKPGPKPKPKEEVKDDPKTDPEGSGDGTDSGSSDGATDEAETGTKEPAKGDSQTDTSEEKATSKGNLFGDEESPSSDSAEAETPKDTPASKVKSAKKSSIFDVD